MVFLNMSLSGEVVNLISLLNNLSDIQQYFLNSTITIKHLNGFLLRILTSQILKAMITHPATSLMNEHKDGGVFNCCTEACRHTLPPPPQSGESRGRLGRHADSLISA